MATTEGPTEISLFNNPLLSDVKTRQTYNGATKEHFAHKAILGAQSKWFLKAFTGGCKEASENTTELLDDDPGTFEYMIKFIYSMKTLIPSTAKAPAQSQALCKQTTLICIRLYQLADKYEVPLLLEQSYHQVRSAIGDIVSEDKMREEIVGACYGRYVRSESVMGKTIVAALNNNRKYSYEVCGVSDPTIRDLVRRYRFFAVDLFLALKDTGRIR